MTFAYADDTAVIVSHKDLNKATDIMQKELNLLSEWSHDSGLVINVDKTKIMHVMPHKAQRHEINLNFIKRQCIQPTNDNITKIKNVTEIKYLGVIVDDKLLWTAHIDNLRKKLRKASYALFHLRNCSNMNILKMVYHSLAESHLRYGITAWGTSSQCKQLQRTQNRLTRLLTNDTRRKILDINNLYKLTMINTYYNTKQYLNKVDHKHVTRTVTDGKYKIPRFLNNFRKHTLPCIIPTLFNELPEELTSITYVESRKLLLKRFFMNKV